MRRMLIFSLTALSAGATGHMFGQPEAATNGTLRSPVKAVTWAGQVTSGEGTAGSDRVLIARKG